MFCNVTRLKRRVYFSTHLVGSYNHKLTSSQVALLRTSLVAGLSISAEDNV